MQPYPRPQKTVTTIPRIPENRIPIPRISNHAGCHIRMNRRAKILLRGISSLVVTLLNGRVPTNRIIWCNRSDGFIVLSRRGCRSRESRSSEHMPVYLSNVRDKAKLAALMGAVQPCNCFNAVNQRKVRRRLSRKAVIISSGLLLFRYDNTRFVLEILQG